jgi:hypothetical protein
MDASQGRNQEGRKPGDGSAGESITFCSCIPAFLKFTWGASAGTTGLIRDSLSAVE